MTPRPAPHIIRWFLRATGFGGITLPLRVSGPIWNQTDQLGS